MKILKMRIHYFILTICLFASLATAKAQTSRTDYQLNKKMEKALVLMDSGRYEDANVVFRNILATEKVLPTNLSYHFALTLYHIKQYRNSNNFLDKYFTLAGKGGDFYDQAEQLKALLNKAFDEIKTCTLCDNNGYTLVTCSVCLGEKNVIETCNKCRAVGKISCQRCQGEGVVIKTDVFGDKKYQTCEQCQGKGLHTCDLCEGKKELNLACTSCLGTGVESSKTICNHGGTKPEQ